MAYCCKCGNFDKSHVEDWDLKLHTNELSYQPDLYYYWDSPLDEDYNWRGAYPEIDCLCEICFDIANSEGKIKWECDSSVSGT